MLARAERSGLSGLTLVLLLAIVATGLALRVRDLDRDTLTHAEVYVPRIAMPAWVSAPPPRHTFAETTIGTLNHDNHPPGYYAFMWGWTAVAGTDLFSLRLPSALMGAATVALLFWVARRRDGEAVALVACGLLALHGHHLFWSQQARMWVFLGFLGVLSVGLLQALRARNCSSTAAAYVAVSTAALWCEYTYWPFFAAQMFWVVVQGADARRMPRALELQLLAMMAATPVLAFLRVHVAMERTGYLAGVSLVDQLTGFFLFQWLLRAPEPPAVYGPVASLAILLLLAAGVGLLVAGVLASPTDDARPEEPAHRPGWWLRVLVAGMASAICGVFVARQEHGAVFAVVAIVPWLLLAAGEGLAREWPRFAGGARYLRGEGRWRRFAEDAASVHTLVPLALLLTATLFVPTVTARSLLFLTPFALWLAVRGLFALARTSLLRTAAATALFVAAAVSVVQYTAERVHRPPYQGLARSLAPHVAAGDVVLVNDDWQTQPLHYYLPPDRYRTGDFGAHLQGLAGPPAERPSRVWLVVLNDRDEVAAAKLAPHLESYREAERVTVSGAHARLLRAVESAQ